MTLPNVAVLIALLPLLQQAQLCYAQTVELFVGELPGQGVYVEWKGSLTALYILPLDADLSSGMPQFSGDTFAWAAFSNPKYSYLTGSALVTYNFNTPGLFNRVPDLFMGEAIGFTAATTVFIPPDYEENLGSPIEGCMLFSGQSFLTMGIVNGVTSSVSWEDPLAVEPTQSITMTTDLTHFDGMATCIPTEQPTQSPTTAPVLTNEPTTRVTLAPTDAPDSLGPIASIIVAGTAVVIGTIGAVGSSLKLFDDDCDDSDDGPKDGSKEKCSKDDKDEKGDWFGGRLLRKRGRERGSKSNRSGMKDSADWYL